jgi:hypothetical protein
MIADSRKIQLSSNKTSVTRRYTHMAMGTLVSGVFISSAMLASIPIGEKQ